MRKLNTSIEVKLLAVADPGFDLRGGRGLACFSHNSIRIKLKINRERKRKVKTKHFGHKKILGPRPLGGARAGCAPPWIR